MKLLVLGNSNFFQKKAYDAFNACGFHEFDVASVSKKRLFLEEKKIGKVFSDYKKAINESAASICYITTSNDLHFPLALSALEKGLHVILDKPATLSLENTKALIEQAEKKRLGLGEANIFLFHDVFYEIQRTFEEYKSNPSKIHLSFQFPIFKDGNFRLNPEMGGGAIFDLAAYAISPGRFFYPKQIYELNGFQIIKNDLIYSFNFTSLFQDGSCITGEFGFDYQYRNFISLTNKEVYLESNRIFSATKNLQLEISGQANGHRISKKINPSCSFQRFLSSFLDSIEKKDFQSSYQNILYDAEGLDKLKNQLIKKEI